MYKLNQIIYENIFKMKDEQIPHFQREEMFNKHPQNDQLATLGVDMSDVVVVWSVSLDIEKLTKFK